MALTQMYDGKNNSPQTALSANITADDSVIPVSDISVFPSAPNLATIGNDDNAEVIRYTGISGSTLTNCERGFGGTTKKSWDAETVISRQITKYDFDAIQGNITELNTAKQNTYSADETQWDTTPTASSVKPVTSGGIKSALDTKQGTLSWDTAPTSGGTNPMLSGAIYNHEPFQVTGTASAGSSVTFTDNRINSEHWKVPKNGIYFGTPANVTSGVRWVTNITSHTITLTATFAGSTTVEIDMLWFQ